MADGERIDPWSSEQSTDYARIRDQFGLEGVDVSKLPNPGMLHRRGIVFAHRDLDVILGCIERSDPFGVLTGLMPSGRMHLGHSMVIDQVRWFQEQGADITVTVADLEALATRGTSLAEGRENAINEYVHNYAALGLDPSNTNVYFQSSRPAVQRLAFTLGRRTNLSEFEAIYGFRGDTNLAHVQAPLVQAGDIIHPQLEEYGGLRPIVVPVGVDQDPHLRLTRGIAGKTHWFNVKPRKAGGLTVALSVQTDNAELFGVAPNGRVDRATRETIFQRLKDSLAPMGYADFVANPKHGTLDIPGANLSDAGQVRMCVLALEREMGGMGLMPPCSTYHRFAVGMTGDKMSSSKPQTTIFMDDSIEEMSKKVKRAFSGGQPTVEEHRRLGGDCSKDVAFQYLQFFFEPDDSELGRIAREYESGRMLAGEIKQICIERASEWLTDLSEKRDMWEGRLDEFLAADAL
ncbi:MAG: tryptophan--tRNA ligase [Euryarchaeota archaeon]|uniref:tryptophan--tRNA ligase n=1 Tax=uncultured marine group II/III euryarchaeote KM3_72_A06 TaxID=1456496 RepID=A0A075HHP4_9EURY|nr:tryptophanyl-tRNA synthetase (WARS, trpS) [uncultured marine group II/III euryarchaeote KM3_72_A06]MAJ18512.1 tryptophan--tRNA ligase [Euryarchaeota archaeon]MCH1511595.1 tryptophan--tRNA ligase [Candidatus Thalassarchaeaceae archaeon]MDC0040798.1 tryptophan--tRNA ligase [Candidatus Poseidoniales archaeon]MDC0256355.1 tryptophan--tRNA ligase [Candidatus Poseidoniales archaeon]